MPLTSRTAAFLCVLNGALFSCFAGSASWPMLRGSAQHSGYVAAPLPARMGLAWAVEFSGERIGTAVEPILYRGVLFITTHAGSLFALNASDGEPLWRFHADSPFLHSPAAHDGLVVAASAGGRVYALDCPSGKPAWISDPVPGGFSAAPIIADETVVIGSRAGEFLSFDLKSGKLLWRTALNAPIRQTAAVLDDRLFVTAEDLRLRCFELASGKPVWTSEPMFGQTARDFYPIALKHGDRSLVMVRTNPLLNMGQRIGRDRTLLCRAAGIDDSSWQKVDAWTKSEQARGRPEQWAREQAEIVDYLDTNPDAQTFYVFDAATGRKAYTAPVLWIGGCQGIGVQPALTGSGELLVFYRSAYANWNHGVAPLVALGLMNLETGRITPLAHNQGRQPPWNTFWGTADEAQNFLLAGNSVLIIHQGTLSRFDLQSHDLAAIWGERDSYGGFRNPPWARNEWHGPARSGIALTEERIYWQTGSRVLCLARNGDNPKSPRTIDSRNVRTIEAPQPVPVSRAALREHLRTALDEFAAREWAPLFCDPGLSGRDFSFANSADTFEALAMAFPHASSEQQAKMKKLARTLLRDHPPFASTGNLSLTNGAPREWFQVPASYRAPLGGDPRAHPFGGLWAAWLWAQRAGEENEIAQFSREIRAAWSDFEKRKWTLDPDKGDLYANRYIASLFAFADLAVRAGAPEDAARARKMAVENRDRLVQWWQNAASLGTLRQFTNSSQLDPFIGKGDLISFCVAPHRHKIALFRDLSPALIQYLKEKCPDAMHSVWRTFGELYPTWYLQGEERQVHYGENFVDPPDLALGGFKLAAWLGSTPGVPLATRLDLPFCRADLYYIEKLGIALDAQE